MVQNDTNTVFIVVLALFHLVVAAFSKKKYEEKTEKEKA